ncbi:MAG: hypothetical protein A2W19_17220 [Spirochaetes bacterium RBG_16_49_21]|nr:MAG: hypothetical protein A2W19_17220 [Spirochaetes bacterium RBG_16_49_21]
MDISYHSKGAKVHEQTIYSRDYRKGKTGTVKIIEIIDGHFARAAVVSGNAEKNYIVEIK